MANNKQKICFKIKITKKLIKQIKYLFIYQYNKLFHDRIYTLIKFLLYMSSYKTYFKKIIPFKIHDKGIWHLNAYSGNIHDYYFKLIRSLF